MSKLTHERHIVRGDHYRDADFLKACEQLHHIARERVIEIAGGFIGDEDGGTRDHGASDTDALLFADR